jgi:hypothetical protein
MSGFVECNDNNYVFYVFVVEFFDEKILIFHSKRMSWLRLSSGCVHFASAKDSFALWLQIHSLAAFLRRVSFCDELRTRFRTMHMSKQNKKRCNTQRTERMRR